MLYVAALLAGYAGFAAYDRTTQTGTTPGATSALLLFGAFALALALAGALVALVSAPRAIEIAPDRITIVGFLRTRRRFPGLGSTTVRILHRYPEGFLGSVPVVSAELSGGAYRRTYLLEEGILAPTVPSG